MSTRIGGVAGVIVACVLLGGVVLAGCGGGGGDSGSGSGGYVEPKGAAKQTISFQAGNFYFKPDKTTVAPGITKIQLTAKGIHDFVFDGAYSGFIVEAENGGSQSKKIDLKPGTYTFYCNVPGHRAAGMEGTLTVK